MARSVSWQQGYDQGFSDAVCGEDNISGMWAETDGERDWMDGYHDGHEAGMQSGDAHD